MWYWFFSTGFNYLLSRAKKFAVLFANIIFLSSGICALMHLISKINQVLISASFFYLPAILLRLNSSTLETSVDYIFVSYRVPCNTYLLPCLMQWLGYILHNPKVLSFVILTHFSYPVEILLKVQLCTFFLVLLPPSYGSRYSETEYHFSEKLGRCSTRAPLATRIVFVEAVDVRYL